MSQSPLLQTALEASRAAAEVIQFYYDRNTAVKVEMKQDYTPVTVADIETEKKIREIILAAFPDHGFYGEETGRSGGDSEYTWLIDPIDGTKSFVRRYPFFSSQIALMKGSELIVGVSNGVPFGELAWAEKGSGAFLNDEPIQVSKVDEMRDAALSTGNIASLTQMPGPWAGYAGLLQQVNRTRGYGDFYHYHLLASGRIELILETDVNILDIAALSVIVNEAGGVMTELDGSAFDLESRTVLAANNRTIYDRARQQLQLPSNA